MDEALLERYRQGDPGAAMALRNHLRAIASRVLDAPQWGVDSPAERRRLEMDVAELVMNSGASDIVGLAALTLAESSERGLEAMRVAQTHVGGDHVPARHLVRLSMEDSPSPQMRGFLAHISDCKACARDVQMVQEVLRSATSARAMTPAPRAPAPDDGETRRLKSKPRPTPTGRAPGKDGKPPPRPRIETTTATVSTSAILGPLLAIIVVVGVTGWFWYSKGEPERRVADSAAYIALLPTEAPPSGRADELEGPARDAAVQLGRGNCRAAADRLLTEGLRDPDNLWLRYYEGLAFVCVRDGARARNALEHVDGLGARPFGYLWWLAQARLIDGDIDSALRALDELGADPEHPRAADARALAARVRAL